MTRQPSAGAIRSERSAMTDTPHQNTVDSSKLDDLALNLFRLAVKTLLLVVPKEKLVELSRRLWLKFWERKMDGSFDTWIGHSIGNRVSSRVSEKIAEDVDEYLSNL